MKREYFVARDGKRISLAIWDEVQAPRAIVQILHGMCEHIARYDEFARFLNENGYIVFGDDHRAHGVTDRDSLGKVGDGNLFEDTVADAKELTMWAKEKYQLPLVLFGHSYGSFLAQRYLTYGTSALAGVVLCGSALMDRLLVEASCLLTIGANKPKNRDKEGTFFASLTFDGYDKKIKEGKGGWLNRDKEEVQKYHEDNFCGYVCSKGFYYYFFRGLRAIAKSPHNLLDKNLRMLIISGEKDEVGGCGKLVKKLANRYVKYGLNPKVILYEGARHEVLNELNKREVYDDVLHFLDDSFI